MPPIFELSGADIELAVDNLTQEYVLRPNTKFALGVAHGRGPIATSTGLMKHESAVLLLEVFDHLGGPVRYLYSIDHDE